MLCFVVFVLRSRSLRYLMTLCWQIPRAPTGWPPGGGAERHMDGGLFRKIMTFVGQGAKAIKYFIFGPE